MEYFSLSCQACLFKCNKVHGLKVHFRKKQHQQKMKELFQDDSPSGHGFFPHIVFIEPKMRCPRVGLSLVTLCFSPRTQTFFYLCHACEEKCPPERISHHISTSDHLNNYFNYIDPNVLRFCWMPSQTYFEGLHHSKIFKQPEILQALHLPLNLIKKLNMCTYSEVMGVLGQNEKLLKVLEASKPQRTMIQAYQRDDNRDNPLLGMQHVVECISVGPTEKRYYLCTLCKLPLATSKIIRHVLSFDHVYTYFKAWHPSTLMSKESYTLSNSFISTRLAFEKQAEEINHASNNEMKQISLEPAEFDSVNFTCYSEALKKLESIAKEKNGGSLITNITPGNKLGSQMSKSTKRPHGCEQTEICTVSPNSEASLYKLCCQNCSNVFGNKSKYSKHLSKQKHKKMWEKMFTKGNSSNGYEKTVPFTPLDLGLYSIIKKNKLAVGVSLVVACVSSQVPTDPVYVCFACQDSFSGSHLYAHFRSNKHLIHTLLYLNPWLLPFGWKHYLYTKDLWYMALEEEKKRERQITLKVFDIPHQLLESLTPLTYTNVMEKLVLHHVCLKRGVPRCETYSKLQQNERFPLLGKQFLVKHMFLDGTEGFLCLLCEKRLVPDEYDCHVFSWVHVNTFLECFHPGSLTSDTDSVTLLDLAKQAACIHPSSNIQEIVLDYPINEPCPYQIVIRILGRVKERHGGGSLKPTITPKSKLFPRKSLKEQGMGNQRDNLQRDCRTLEVCENTRCETSTDGNEETSEKILVKPGSEIVNNGSVKSAENAEMEAQNTSGETFHCIKEEVMVEIKKEKEEEAITVMKEVKMENNEVPATEDTSPSHCTDTTSLGEMTNKSIAAANSSATTVLSTASTKCIEPTYNCTATTSSAVTIATCKAASPTGSTVVHKDAPIATHCETANQRRCETSTDSNDKTSEKILVKPSSEVVNNGSVKREENTETESHNEILTTSNQQSERLKTEDEVNNTSGETFHCIKKAAMVEMKKEKEEEATMVIKVELKVEDIKVPAMSETLLDIPGSSQSPHNVDGAEAEEKESNKIALTQSTSHVAKIHKMKRQNSMCEESQEDTGWGGHMAHKRQRLSFQGDAVCTESPKMPSGSVRAPAIQDTSPSHGTAATFLGEVSNKSVAAANSSATTVLSTASTKCSEPAYSCTTTTSSAAATATCKAAHTSPTGSAVVHKDAPIARHCETATQTTAPLAKISVKRENAGASSKTVYVENVMAAKDDNAPHIHTSHPPAPRPTTATSAHKSPPTEPSHASTMKTRPGENPVGVGFNQMIRVVCGERLQIYCMMCSVKLKCSSHRYSTSHQLKYVRKMFPGCRAEPGGSKWEKIIANLAEVERDLGTQNSQKIVVTNGEYDELRSLPEETAIEKLKIMLSEIELQMASGSTTGILQPAITSPCEVSSPDGGTFMPQNTTPRLSTKNQPEQENKQQETQLISTSGETEQSDRAQSCTDKGPEADDLTPDQLQPEALKSDPDPIPPENIQNTGTAVTVKQEAADPDVESQAQETQNQGEEGLEVDPIMGLGFVWECRGMSGDLFFLCESCKENNIEDCFAHMTSYSHRYNYTQWKHPLFLDSLQMEDFPSEFKSNTLRLIARSISQRESHSQTDVRIALLTDEVYEWLRRAPFSEAFEMLQKIEKEEKLDISCAPIITTQQTSESHQPKKQPEKQLNQEQSPPTDSLKTDPRSDHEAKQKTENHHLKKATVGAGNLDGVNCEKVLSPPFVACVSSKADSVFSSRSGAGIPRDSSKSLSTPPEIKPHVSACQRPVPELQVKQAVLRSDSQSFRAARPESTQSLSLSSSDERRLVRKRPVDTCVETPLPVKRTCSSLPQRSLSKPEPACESPPVYPATVSAPLPGSHNLKAAPVQVATFDELIALVKRIKSEKESPSNSPPDNAKSTLSRANSSPKSSVGQWDSKSEQAKMKLKEGKTRPLSKYEQIKAILKNKPRFPTSTKGAFSDVLPAVLDDKHQHFAPNSNPSLSTPNNSFHEVQSTRGSDSSATEATAVSTTLPSVSTAEPNAPIISENVSAPQTHGVVTDRFTGQMSQSRGDTNINVCLLPIQPILTTRKPPSDRQQLVGNNKRQEIGIQNVPTLSTVETANQSKNPAASGWYDQNGQMSCVTTGHAVHLSEQPTNNQLFTYQSVYTPDLYQPGGYTASRVYQGHIDAGHVNPGHVNPDQLHSQSFGYSLPAQGTPWFVLQIQQQHQ